MRSSTPSACVYYASSTGSGLDRHPIQREGDPCGPPRFLYSQVHRYGPRRWWVRGLLGLVVRAQDVDLVWESEHIAVGPDVMSPDYMQVVHNLMYQAEIEAERLREADRIRSRSRP